MGKINWGRVVLCGIVVGSVYSLLGLPVFLFALGETAYMQAVQKGLGGDAGLWSLVFFMNLVGGIWTIWLYAAIRPRYGAGPKTAAVAGVAVWFLAALLEAELALMGIIPLSLGAVAVPLAVNLPLVVVAAVVGAW